MKSRQIILGCLFWVAVVAGVTVQFSRTRTTERYSTARVFAGIGEWIAGRKSSFAANAETWLELTNGDPILARQADGSWLQVGVVEDTFVGSNLPTLTKQASVSIYDSATVEFSRGFQLRYYTTPQSLEWVAGTMIPADRQRQIVSLIAADWKKHQEEIAGSLTPLIQEGTRRAVTAIEAELPQVIERYRNDFSRLGERYKTEILQTHVVPLVKDHVLPIVLEEVRPVADELGRSLWNRVSLWSFTWRYVYDVSPLPERQAVRKEFDRFLSDEAIPEIQRRMPEFIEVTQRIIDRISRDPKVSETIRMAMKTVASDPELHTIVGKILHEAIVRNQTLRKSMDDYLQSPKVRAALNLTSTRFEPTARAIGDLIIGSREKGVTPEFARILRAQILLKDRHWLILSPVDERQEGTGIRIVPGTDPMMFPLIFEGTVQSPLSEIR